MSVTSQSWLTLVLAEFDTFLIDHAAAEKKASGMAMSMALRYRDRTQLVKEMIDLSIEELQHFRECVRLLHSKGLALQPDERDPYVNELHKEIRHGREEGLLDRLLVGGIVEARGCERFGLVADGLPSGDLKTFYEAITASEQKHQGQFIVLAECYFKTAAIQDRLSELQDFEAELVERLPYRAALH